MSHWPHQACFLMSQSGYTATTRTTPQSFHKGSQVHTAGHPHKEPGETQPGLRDHNQKQLRRQDSLVWGVQNPSHKDTAQLCIKSPLIFLPSDLVAKPSSAQEVSLLQCEWDVRCQPFSSSSTHTALHGLPLHLPTPHQGNMTDSAPTGVEGARHRMGPNMQLQRAELRSTFASSLSLGNPSHLSALEAEGSVAARDGTCHCEWI